MTPIHSFRHPPSVLKIPEIRFFLGAVGFFTLANRALVVVIGFQIYKLTHSALALGFLGLVEAIPALSLALFGGYIADRVDRRKILLVTRGVSTLCAFALAVISSNPQTTSLFGLYSVIFVAGIARGFSDPAATAMEAQIVPQALTVNASSWIGSTWLSCSIIGPASVGFSYDFFGVTKTYSILGMLFAASWACMAFVSPKAKPPAVQGESVFRSISLGLKFVFGEQALVSAMALDLFAVLFGGQIALLPIFATDILHVGAKGLGLLNAATAAGALIIMMISTRYSPIRDAGRNLLLCVAGFGVSMLAFAFSKNFLLSLACLFLSGIFDGVSMVIRRSTLRLLSPEHMRGRVAAVSWIFVGASNELGAFESGFVAHWIGAIPCVWAGGLTTLVVVACTAIIAPKLRQLQFDPKNLNRLN